MIRIVTALFTILTFVVYGQGDPPTVMKGVRQTSKNISLTVELPNKQATKTGSIASRIETGNQNLLENPSFEHSTLLTGHTLTNATSASEATLITEGKKAAIITITSSGTWLAASEAYTQPGLSALVQADIKTSTTGVSLCSVADSVDQNCVDIIADGLYHTYSIPSVTRSSTLGYAVKVKSGSTVSSGSFYIDNVSVGRADTIIGTYAVQSASFEDEAGYGSTATKIPYYSTVAKTSGGGLFSYTNDSTNGLKITALQDILITASYTLVGSNVLGFGFSINGSPTTTYDSQASSVLCGMGIRNSTASIDRGGATCTVKLSAGDILRPHVNTASTNAANNVRVTAQQAVNVVTAPNNNGWLTFDPQATGNQGFGTMTNKECLSKRENQDLIISCKFTPGTTTASEARIPLVYNGVALTSAATDLIPTIKTAGTWTYTSVGSASNGQILMEPSVGYFTFGYQSGSSGGGTKQIGNNIGSNSISMIARIPISGWAVNPITGSFVGIPSVPSYAGQSHLFSFHYGTTNGTTVCSASPCSYLDQSGNGVSSVTRASAGTYTIVTTISYTKLNCSITPSNGGNAGITGYLAQECKNTSSCAFTTALTGTGVLDTYGLVICHGTY